MTQPQPTRDDATPATPADSVSYDEWAESEDLAGLNEWNELLDSDEEFYLDADDEGTYPADPNGPIDIAELNDLDDSLASDD